MIRLCLFLFLSVALVGAQDVRLPHADNLVSLLIVDEDVDWLTKDEAIRVLSPGGMKIQLGEDLKVLLKGGPDPSQDWTHYQFDASNNMVGTDREQGTCLNTFVTVFQN